MTDVELPPGLSAAIDRLGELVEGLEQRPESPERDEALELLRCVDAIHRPGLRRLAALMRESGLAEPALASDEVRLLFELYDLIDGGERERIDAVLDLVRPELESSGARLDLVEATERRVTVRVSGAAAGDDHSPGALRQVVEQVLRDALPEVERVEILNGSGAHRHAHENGHGHSPGGHRSGASRRPHSQLIPLSSIEVRRHGSEAWKTACQIGDVPADGVLGVRVEEEPVLVVHLGGEARAYHDACPDSPLPLHGGRVDGGMLECPWHRCRFDLASGRRVGATGPGLDSIPVSVDDGQVRVRLEHRHQPAP